MLLWDKQSCIPFLKIVAHSRAEEERRKQQAAGTSPRTSPSTSQECFGEHREPGRGRGCEPSDVHHSLWGSRNEDFVSELNCTEETLALSPVGFFDQIIFSTLNFPSVDNGTDTDFCCWGHHAEPGLLVIPHFKSHTNTSKVSLDLQGTVGSSFLIHMAVCLSRLIHEQEPTWLNLRLLRAEVFSQQPEHPERVCLEERGTNAWAKAGLDLEADRLTGRLKQIVLGSKHIVPLLLPCVLPRGICSL